MHISDTRKLSKLISFGSRPSGRDENGFMRLNMPSACSLTLINQLFLGKTSGTSRRKTVLWNKVNGCIDVFLSTLKRKSNCIGRGAGIRGSSMVEASPCLHRSKRTDLGVNFESYNNQQ